MAAPGAGERGDDPAADRFPLALRPRQPRLAGWYEVVATPSATDDAIRRLFELRQPGRESRDSASSPSRRRSASSLALMIASSCLTRSPTPNCSRVFRVKSRRVFAAATSAEG